MRWACAPVMVTGDAPATAAIVAHAVGLERALCPPGTIPDRVLPQDFAVFASILRPTVWLVLSSIADLLVITMLAIFGIAMAALPIVVLAGEFAAAVIFGLMSRRWT